MWHIKENLMTKNDNTTHPSFHGVIEGETRGVLFPHTSQAALRKLYCLITDEIRLFQRHVQADHPIHHHPKY